jgi:hypothetical protein
MHAMLSTEREEFNRHLGILFGAFGPPLTAERKEAYWLGLHDCRLSEIAANVAKLCKLARKGAAVPRPADLRNIAPNDSYRQRDPKLDAEFEAAVARNKRNWDEFHREDPELAAIELRIAVAGRILARDPEGSPQYAEALRADHKARDDRVGIWRERAAKNPPIEWKKR